MDGGCAVLTERLARNNFVKVPARAQPPRKGMPRGVLPWSSDKIADGELQHRLVGRFVGLCIAACTFFLVIRSSCLSQK